MKKQERPVPIEKILFRERAVRAILGERRERDDWIWLKDLTDHYNLPYHKTLHFLKRLAERGIITWRRSSKRKSSWNPLFFRVTESGKKILEEELKYAYCLPG